MTDAANGRFYFDWIDKPAKRELMERPAYEDGKDDEPVYFTHPSLEPWLTRDTW